MGSAQSAGEAVLEFDIPCDLARVRAAGERVRQFLIEHGRPQPEVIDAELATVEACNNASNYAKGEAKKQPVKLCAKLSATELVIEVVDHTPGFEWPEKAVLPAANAESGRGVFLIQVLMHKTEYVRGHGENRLVMRRRLESPLPLGRSPDSA